LYYNNYSSDKEEAAFWEYKNTLKSQLFVDHYDEREFKIALAMATHSRLGADSPLAELGDTLSLVPSHVFS
jgi:hypothetical protein